jgi:N-acyl-D-amino-acid deacylase
MTRSSRLLSLAYLGAILYGPWIAAMTEANEPERDRGLEVRVSASVEQFLATHQIPGAAIAITRDGQMLASGGFGVADTDHGTPVTAASLFRIASVSKPITAVAILQLVEQNQLKLTDPVFEVLPFDPFLEHGQLPDERQKAITIEHLLEHRGGWDRDASFDAMFQSVAFAELVGSKPPAGTSDIIRVMSGKPLDFAPGERYAYSNYGYCLLGRVIEQVTGKSYEQAVKDQVLTPLGIRDMHLGRTRLEDRRANEVRYYHPGAGSSVFSEDLHAAVPHPYGAWHLEAMDAHGGWLASATDLARFAASLDHPDQCPVLSAKSVARMFARPVSLAGQDEDGASKRQYYALGWSVTVEGDQWVSTSHTGSLPGTSTRIERRADGTNVVVLLNSRHTEHKSSGGHSLADMLTARLYEQLQP